MDKKTVTLNIGRKIDMLGRPTPTLEGRAMTVGDLTLQRIPIAASRDTDHATRLWSIGLEMDKAKTTKFTMSELDFELLKNSILDSVQPGEMQVWARIALDRLFKEAKKE